MSVNVLLADDSKTMRTIIRRSLEALGVSSITEAADGVEAVNLFQQQEFTLVLTDWNMPNKNGLEVIQEIRSKNTRVPIIMITTEAEKRQILRAIEAGVTDYLVKPFETDVLREKLAKHGCN
jgi:two-component system, chemotaxis family, chemotaxis protein CheY